MSFLPTLVKGLIAEAAREIVPAILDRVKRKLADNGIITDEAMEALMMVQLAALHVACQGIVDEFAAAEARGLANPLGGGAIEFIECCNCDPTPPPVEGGMCTVCGKPEFRPAQG